MGFAPECAVLMREGAVRLGSWARSGTKGLEQTQQSTHHPHAATSVADSAAWAVFWKAYFIFRLSPSLSLKIAIQM